MPTPRPGEAQALESAAAVAEATAALRDPKTQAAIASFQGNETPAPEPEDVQPEPEAPEQEDGSLAEPAEVTPAVPDPDDDDEEITDDYDPEAQVTEPEPETPETPTPETPPETTTPPVEAALSPEEVEEYRQWRAEQKEQAEQPEPEPAEPGKDPLIATVERLTQERPEVADLADKVGRVGQQLRDRAPKIDELQAKVSPTGDLAKSILEANTMLTYHQKRAESPETDPDEVKYAITSAKMALVDAENEFLKSRQELQSLEFVHAREAQDYELTLGQLKAIGQDELDAQTRTTQQEASDQEEYDRTVKEWEAALPSVMSEWKLSKALSSIVNDHLSVLSEGATDDELLDTAGWMRSQKDKVLGRIDLIRQETAKERAEKLSADADIQPAPSPSRAVAKEPSRSKAPVTHREADQQAARTLAASLGGKR